MTKRVPLRNALKVMLETKALTESELETLLHLQNQATKPRWSLSARWFSATFASVVIGLLIVSVTLFKQPSIEIQQRIAHEVLINHLNIKPLDVETDSISQVKAYFDRLDFVPQLSKYASNEGAVLIGGRYCTLQGTIAAQLRFRLPSGEVMTYYQAAYDPKRFGKLPDAEHDEPVLLLKERGFRMHLWQESGLVMVTAQQDN